MIELAGEYKKQRTKHTCGDSTTEKTPAAAGVDSEGA